MLELHDSYYDYYTKPTTNISYYYTHWYDTDADVEAWKAASPTHTNATIVRMDQKCTSTANYQNGLANDFATPCCKKFDDPTSDFALLGSMRDLIVCRLGEAYLIAAEAAVKLNKPDEAAALINRLRQRPGVIKSGYESAMKVYKSEMTIDFILDERARELYGEYKRWEDLKRTGKLVEYVVKRNHETPLITEQDFLGTDGQQKILRPIPLSAIELNKAVVTQNPGF